ncbi:MAG: hypothetical protein GX264_06960 [Clostridiales bacterium]|jgi:energy-coupling factor transporter ATP-binding protein EcfA2|nr:hypothetical protein [Clostridiales bacterium]
MISLILGSKGSGKTKKLLDLLNIAIESSEGNVVCVEKTSAMSHQVNYRARLVLTDDYGIEGFEAFYGFLGGLCAGDHDITDIFVDATLRIGSRDMNELAAFLKRVEELSKSTETKFVFTISADAEAIPAEILDSFEILD